MRSHTHVQVFSAKRILAGCLALLAGAFAPAQTFRDLYDPSLSTSLGPLSVASGTINIDTSGASPSMTGAATATGQVKQHPSGFGDVAVFRFDSVDIAAGVTVTVTGDKPLSIVTAGDFNFAGTLNVTPGTTGGGAGGTGGVGGAGGAGGGGGNGGNGGNGGAGGAGGNWNQSGGNGTNGDSGLSGAVGSNGVDGAAGTPGGVGGVGFGIQGAPGVGGGAAATGGTRGNGSTTNGAAGTGGTSGGNGTGSSSVGDCGSSTASNGGAGGPGNPGGNASSAGATGSVPGTSGQTGTDALGGTGFATTLSLSAGNGGGGGGGGAGGGGGGGGAGGGGAGGGKGGGGGGGARIYCIIAGIDEYRAGGGGGGAGSGGQGGGGGGGAGGGGGGGATNLNGTNGGTISASTTGAVNNGAATAGNGGSPTNNDNGGAAGTSPGSGGVGGSGGAGGNGGAGGAGSTGGGGGGAVILSTTGVMRFTGVANLSAGVRRLGGAAGAGESGRAGGTGANGLAGGGGGAGSDNQDAHGGDGGAGGAGGKGGNGSAGGAGGSGTAGGNGGYGIPGSLKLHGSIIITNSGGPTGGVIMDNVLNNVADRNGIVTRIDNMVDSLAASIAEVGSDANATPTITDFPAANVTTLQTPQLLGTNSFSNVTSHPKIGELASGTAATEGVLEADFWNEANLPAPSTERLDYIRVTHSTAANPFRNFDQVFLRNNTAETLTNVYLRTSPGKPASPGSPGVLIPTSVPGTLGPGEVFTTTIPSSVAVGNVFYNTAIVATNPNNITVNFGYPATFSTTVSASDGQIKYQWQIDNDDNGLPDNFVNIPGATSNVYTIPGTGTPDNQNMLRCVIKDNTDTKITNHALLTVNLDMNAAGPVIVSPNGGGKYYTGDVISLSGNVFGPTGDWFFVWRRGNSPVRLEPDNTQNVYTIFLNPSDYGVAGPATPAVSGNYNIVVTQLDGTQTGTASVPGKVVFSPSSNPSIPTPSLWVPVTVKDHTTPDPITGGGTYRLGDTIALGVTLVANTGHAPYTYQWQYDEGLGFVNIPEGGRFTGTQTPNLSISAAIAGDTKPYRVIVNDSVTDSVPATPVNVLVSNQLVAGPTNLDSSSSTVSTVYVGGNLVLSVSPQGGDGDYAFTWTKDSTPISNGGVYSGATTNTLTITGAALGDAGSYACVVTDDDGDGGSGDPDDTSTPLAVGVVDNLSIVTDPQPITRNVTQTATFTVVTAGGIQPFTYLWEFDALPIEGSYAPLSNGGRISGADTATLSVSNLSLSDAGEYRVTVSAAGVPVQTVTSATALLTLTNNPGINFGAASRNLYDGQNITLAPTVLGGIVPQYNFTWEVDLGTGFGPVVDGGIYSGATTGALTITGIDTSNAGIYRLTVDDGVNLPATEQVTVNVFQAVFISTQPFSTAVYEGATASFSVVATGGIGALNYDWRQDTVSLGAPSQDSLDIVTEAGDNGTTIDVVVTDTGVSDGTGPGNTSTSGPATLTVGTELFVLGPSPNLVNRYQVAPNADPRTLSVVIDGGLGAVTTEWFRRDTSDLSVVSVGPGTPTVTGSNYVIDPPTHPLGKFEYFCVGTDLVGNVQSGLAIVNVANHMAITPPGLVDASAPEGDAFAFSIVIDDGIAPFNYDWAKDDGSKAFQVIQSGPSNTLSFASLVEADEGDYQVTITDAGGDVLTDTATLTVDAGLPAAGMVGLLALVASTGLAGALTLRKRR